MKATHNGTCQVCGQVQAVSRKDGRLAKHGYTVEWGYFSGVCPGAGYHPLEEGSAAFNRVIPELAARAEKLAAKTIEDIKLVKISHRQNGKEMITACENDEQVKAVRYYETFERLAKSELWSLHQEAKHTQAHVDFMNALREERQGQPLYEREQKPTVQQDKFVEGNYRDAYIKIDELKASGKYSKVTSRKNRYGEIWITATIA